LGRAWLDFEEFGFGFGNLLSGSIAIYAVPGRSPHGFDNRSRSVEFGMIKNTEKIQSVDHLSMLIVLSFLSSIEEM
jgi:hypothetical protein